MSFQCGDSTLKTEPKEKLMYTLTIIGTRRNALAVHQCESYADLRELLAVYAALGYAPEALQVELKHAEQAA